MKANAYSEHHFKQSCLDKNSDPVRLLFYPDTWWKGTNKNIDAM